MSPCRAAVFRPLSWAPSYVQPSPELSLGASSWLLGFSGAEPLGAQPGYERAKSSTIHKKASLAPTHPASYPAHPQRCDIRPRKSGAESLVPRQKLRALSTWYFWILVRVLLVLVTAVRGYIAVSLSQSSHRPCVNACSTLGTHPSRSAFQPPFYRPLRPSSTSHSSRVRMKPACVWFGSCFLAMLRMEPRPLCMLGKHSC